MKFLSIKVLFIVLIIMISGCSFFEKVSTYEPDIDSIISKTDKMYIGIKAVSKTANAAGLLTEENINTLKATEKVYIDAISAINADNKHDTVLLILKCGIDISNLLLTVSLGEEEKQIVDALSIGIKLLYAAVELK